jgi:hypothetical protein
MMSSSNGFQEASQLLSDDTISHLTDNYFFALRAAQLFFIFSDKAFRFAADIFRRPVLVAGATAPVSTWATPLTLAVRCANSCSILCL